MGDAFGREASTLLCVSPLPRSRRQSRVRAAPPSCLFCRALREHTTLFSTRTRAQGSANTGLPHHKLPQLSERPHVHRTDMLSRSSALGAAGEQGGAAPKRGQQRLSSAARDTHAAGGWRRPVSHTSPPTPGTPPCRPGGCLARAGIQRWGDRSGSQPGQHDERWPPAQQRRRRVLGQPGGRTRAAARLAI